MSASPWLISGRDAEDTVSVKGSSEVVLLTDEPSGSDDFDAKAHEQVAAAIAKLIETERGGSVIGLEGAWGAGKSTVVRLLRVRLEAIQPPKTATCVLVFDAWAHQGDPLRRTFLETLARRMEEAEWLSSRSAQEVRDTLSGRASTVHTKSTATLSWEGKLASAAAALLPLGAVLLANDWNVHHRKAQVLGLVLLLSPLVVVLGFAAAKGVGVMLGGRKKSGFLNRLAALPLFSFFAKEQDVETVSSGIDRGDPTSVEFERTFGEILEESLTASRRLVIVFDNLDRVEERDAKSILATMQTFTRPTSDTNVTWWDSVWTLIPYDPSGLDRLWSSARDETDLPGASAGRSPLTESTSAAFVERVFQVRFETPPLVLSDWRGYLARLLDEAIPGSSEEEVQTVLRLRALYRGAEPTGVVARDSPTPRQLKQFVNQIGAVRRQRDDVPITHVAYHALLRRDRIDVASRLIERTLPHASLIPLLGEGIAEDLAAIHFGTERSLAQQLLLTGALENAFAEGDSDSVQRLLGLAGFSDALDGLDMGRRAGDGGVELTRTVAVLDRAAAFAVPALASWLARAVLPVARKVELWAPSGAVAGEGLGILLDALSPDADEHMGRMLGRVTPHPADADSDGHLHLEGVAALLDTAKRRGRDLGAARVVVDISPDELTSALEFFGSCTVERSSWAAIDLTLDETAVAAALVKDATSETYAHVPRALEVLLTRPERVDLATLGAGCVDAMGSQDPTSSKQLAILLRVVEEVTFADPNLTTLATAADGGILANIVHVAVANGWFEQAAQASLLHLLVHPSVGTPSGLRQSANGVQLIRTIMQNPSADTDFVVAQTEWLAERKSIAVKVLLDVLASDATFEPWVEYQLVQLHAASALELSPNQYLTSWATLKASLPTGEFDELTKRLLANKERRKVVMSERQPSLALAVIDAGHGEDYSSELRGWAADILKGASGADWEAALLADEGGAIVDLALRVQALKGPAPDPPGLSDALHAHFQALADGATAWQPGSAEFVRLTSLLSAGARKSVASLMCAALEGRDGKVGPGLFATYDLFFSGERDFLTHRKLPNFLERAVANDQWSTIEWFVDVAETHPDALTTEDRDDEMGHLRHRVSEKLDEAGEERPAALTRLADLLSVQT